MDTPDYLQKAKDFLDGMFSKLKSDPSVKKLKEEILACRAFIQDMLKVMNDNNVGGLEHAVVIRKGTSHIHDLNGLSYNDFRQGSTVIINPESTFAKQQMGYPEGEGTIESFDPEGFTGWALVNFKTGNKEERKPLRYGNPHVDEGACDLILISQPILTPSDRETLTVVCGGRIVEVTNFTGIEVVVGNTVLISPRNGQMLSKVDSLKSGLIGIIDEVLEDQLVIAVNGEKRIVLQNPDLKGQYDRGQRVTVDSGFNVALSILPRSKSIAISSGIEAVTWDSVIGLEDAKKEARRILNQVKYPELYKAYKEKSSNGILLIGPTGNGKTRFGKAVATEISESFGGEEGVIEGFMYIKSTEILDMYVGESPRKVRDIFAKAEEFHKRTGRKAIIFIDEIDAVIAARGKDKSNGSADSITNAFLTEMDGIQESSAFVIGATNRPDLLDTAAMRPGRFDKKIYVGRPHTKDVPKFFEMYLKGLPLAAGLTLQNVVDHATTLYCSKDYTLYDLVFEPLIKADTNKEGLIHQIALKEVGSGAMIEGITQDAKRLAIERDINAVAADSKPTVTGLSLEDITAAFVALYIEQKRLSHDEALSEYCNALPDLQCVDVKKKLVL